MLRRYLAVVAIILATIVALGVWLKPPLEKMREDVDAGLAGYARANAGPGREAPPVSHVESSDWLIAVSQSARVGDLIFFCFGAFKLTVCSLPGA